MDILPNRGVGLVSLGMSTSEVRRVLGGPSREFVRSQYSPCVEWDYQGRGLNVIFDRRGSCAGVLLTPPSNPTLDGNRLLGVGAAAAWETVRRLDPSARVEDGSLTSARLGVSIYAPDVDEEPAAPAYSVLVFRHDYFELK